MGRSKDRFWQYVEKVDKGFKCHFCNLEFSGGASRIKSHLSCVERRDIDICKNVPEDVQSEAYEAIGGPRKKLKSTSISRDAMESNTSSSISKIKKGKVVTQVFI